MRKTVLTVKDGCLSKEAQEKLTQISKSGIHLGNLINKWILDYEIKNNRR